MFSKALVVAALVTAALGSWAAASDDDSGGTPVASGGAAAAELPKEIRSKGTLTVAADATYPPNEFLAEDGKTDRRDVTPISATPSEKALGIELRGGSTLRSTASSRASRPASTTSASRASPTPRSASRPSTS